MVVEESAKSIPDSNSKSVCRNQFSNNVTRKDCCCTEVGEAYRKECNLCPKPGSSKLHSNVFLYLGQSSVFLSHYKLGSRLANVAPNVAGNVAPCVQSRVINRTAESAFSTVNPISWHQAKAPSVT